MQNQTLIPKRTDNEYSGVYEEGRKEGSGFAHSYSKGTMGDIRYSS